MKKTLGGDRIGSGKKMQVDLHNYERSTHDLGYIWRSSMAAGTLVPFIVQVALPGDTFDISLDAVIKTHPTIGPLFGSYKVQADVYLCPIRLYQGKLHNNKLGIGMRMSEIKLPTITLWASNINTDWSGLTDFDNAQINPSCILSYLGIRGIGTNAKPTGLQSRDFNAVPLLAYWDIYKNYYANKQEEIGAVIHTPIVPNEPITVFTVAGDALPQWTTQTPRELLPNEVIVVTGTTTYPVLGQTKVLINNEWKFLAELSQILWIPSGLNSWIGTNTGLTITLVSWDYAKAYDLPATAPTVQIFALDDIDDMREAILAHSVNNTPFSINAPSLSPYDYLAISTPSDAFSLPYRMTQEGLGLKTYQSDLHNNWLSTDWIDGVDGITAITSIDTSGGSFSIDTLNLSKKVYDMLNRIAVSGGSYDDWIDAVYTHDRFTRIESPVYMGGLIKELVFQEVVSNSASEVTQSGEQPLGTLAGKGVMSNKHKGGNIYVKVDEPSYIIGIISLTPRIDYSQGNSWDCHLKTMDDFHKPALDEIGFQELIQEQMGWWTTNWDETNEVWVQQSAGKQPAWINYMTNVNKTYGNFAIKTNEMFMTLNRRYEWMADQIGDLTTYVDPSKFNQIFAQTSLDAQNFWTQIAVDITARRKMSAKIMPNL